MLDMQLVSQEVCSRGCGASQACCLPRGVTVSSWQSCASPVCYAACSLADDATHSRPAMPCLQEYNDAMLTVFMSSLTKGVQGINEVVDKHTIAYERSSRRRGMG